MLRMSWILLHCLTDAIDMHRDRSRIAERIHPPDARIKSFSAVHHIRMEHEIFQQLEFLIRQHLFFATHEDTVRILLERDISERDALLCLRLSLQHQSPAPGSGRSPSALP